MKSISYAISVSPEKLCTLYINSEYDALIKGAMREMNRDKRIEAMHKAEAILMRDLPLLPIYFYSTPYMQSARVKGIYLSPRYWPFFRNAEVVE